MNRSTQLMKDTGKDPVCPYCKATAKLQDSQLVYGGESYGNMWICSNFPTCDSYVGVHKHGKWMNFPLGILANGDLREAKKLAHSKFDLLWKTQIMYRQDAYRWLQKAMEKEPLDAHIGEMSFDECLKVYNLAKDLLDSKFINP